jgi:hypothetical protein
MVKIGDKVEVDFNVEGVLTSYSGIIVGKGRGKCWKVDFEDGESLDVPCIDVRPAKDKKDQGGNDF